MDEQMEISFLGRYNSRAEIERETERKKGDVAQTEHASYCFDGEEWRMIHCDQYIEFKVVKRYYEEGRGYVTVAFNPELLPIDKDRAAVCKGQFRLPIHIIEIWMAMTDMLAQTPYYGLITSDETIGDWLTVRMYPDEENEPISKEE